MKTIGVDAGDTGLEVGVIEVKEWRLFLPEI